MDLGELTRKGWTGKVTVAWLDEIDNVGLGNVNRRSTGLEIRLQMIVALRFVC